MSEFITYFPFLKVSIHVIRSKVILNLDWINTTSLKSHDVGADSKAAGKGNDPKDSP